MLLTIQIAELLKQLYIKKYEITKPDILYLD